MGDNAAEIPSVHVYSRSLMLQARHAHTHQAIKHIAVEERPDLVPIEPACIAMVLAAAGGKARLRQVCVAVQGLEVLRVSRRVKDLEETVLAVVQGNPEQ